MKIYKIPQNGWIYNLKHGDPFIEDHVYDKIHLAKDMTEVKHDIISQMTDTITECAQVIQHANEMKTPKTCTCDKSDGDKI